MKNHLILSSKVLTGIFLLLCAIGISWVIFHNDTEIEVSVYYFIPFAIITVLTALVFFIMFICEMVVVFKEKDNSRTIKLIMETFLIIIVWMAVDIIILKNKTDIILICGTAIAICMISFALHFWKRKTT